MTDMIMLRFTACLLSAALPGSLLPFKIDPGHSLINTFFDDLGYLFFWKLIHGVQHAIYKKSGNDFNFHPQSPPCYYGMDHGCTELLKLFHNPCLVCVRTVLSLFLLLPCIPKQTFQIIDYLSVLFHPVTDWGCCFFYVFCFSPLPPYIPQSKSLTDIVILTIFVKLDIM